MFDSCNPMDCSPLGSFVHGIFQARILKWGLFTTELLGKEAPRLCSWECCCCFVVSDSLPPLFATCSTPGFSVLPLLHLLKLMSTESVMPSNLLVLCCPLLLLPSIFPSSRVFSNESPLPIRWQKVLECNMGMQNDTITLGTNLKEFLKKLIVHFII